MTKRKRANALVSDRQNGGRDTRRKAKPTNTQDDSFVFAETLLASSVDPSTDSQRRVTASSQYASSAGIRYRGDLGLYRNPLPTARRGASARNPQAPHLEASPFPRDRSSTIRKPTNPREKHHGKSQWGRPYASQIFYVVPRFSGRPLEPTDSPVRVPKLGFMSILTLNRIANVPISGSFRYAKHSYGHAHEAYYFWLQHVSILNMSFNRHY